MKKPLLLALIGAQFSLMAQSPELTAWKMNVGGDLGNYTYYASQPSSNPTSVNMTDSTNVLKVCYNNTHVYVRSKGLADYNMGPFTSNPNQPAAQNYVFKLSRTPTAATTNQYTIGTIGVTINGLKFYGPSDARSYKSSTNTNVSGGDGIWWSDAWVSEGGSMDATGNGHPDQNGNYHHHANPIQLYSDPSTAHSPIIGYAMDGYPIYGPFGYTSATNSSSGITRMSSSYQLRNITVRTTLPDGSTSSPAGPAVSSSFPLGTYMQDYEYVAGSGTLDAFNGRTCVTPEYPSGTYAYFIATDSNGDPDYPYILPGYFYGNVSLQDLQQAGSSTIPSTNITCYTPGTVGIAEIKEGKLAAAYPNPASDLLNLNMEGSAQFEVTMTSLTGQTVRNWKLNGGYNTISLKGIATGIYMLSVKAEDGTVQVIRIVKE
jgi:hypothetical protein